MENSSPLKKIVNLNLPQMMLQLVQANTMLLLWGRGTGKTTGGIGPRMVQLAEAMPGHLSGIFGMDFETIEKNILPKFIQGMEMSGYYRDQHFVVGKKPPDSWPKCLYPIKKWEHTIAWHNGTVFQEISLFKKGSANAFDFQSGIFDEAKFMDVQQLNDEVYPTFRGFKDRFGHLPEYLSKMYASDKYIDLILLQWLIDFRKRVDKDKVETVIQLQLHINELEQQLPTAGRKKAKLISIINDLKEKIAYLRKDLVYVSEASAMDNIENLGPEWLRDKEASMTEYEFEVAIKNEDPEKAKSGYYPSLSEKNFIEDYIPIDPHQPIVGALDYQHSVTPLVITQVFNVPGTDKPAINFLKDYITKHPEGIEECIEQFCMQNISHPTKIFYYVFDSTAIGRRQSADTFHDIVIRAFKKHKWVVVRKYIGDPPDHDIKYESIKNWIKGSPDQRRVVRFHRKGVKRTIASMQGAAAITGTGGKTKKDKRYENTSKHPDIDQVLTTHLSDCVDQLLIYWYGRGKSHGRAGTGGARVGG